MNAPSIIPTDTLPVLIDRATAALDCARSSAEIAQWVRMSEHARLAVMAQLSGRFVQWPALQAARSALDEVAVPPGSCHRPDMP